jgi:hypothetical protein
MAIGESSLGLLAIAADPDHLGLTFLESRKRLAEPASFERSTRGGGLGKEEQHGPVAPQSLQRQPPAPGIGQVEGGRGGTDSRDLAHESALRYHTIFAQAARTAIPGGTSEAVRCR